MPDRHESVKPVTDIRNVGFDFVTTLAVVAVFFRPFFFSDDGVVVVVVVLGRRCIGHV